MATKRKPTKKAKTGSGTTGPVTKRPAPSKAAAAEEGASSGESAQNVRDRQRRAAAASTPAESADSDADGKEPRKRAGGKRRWPLYVALSIVALVLVAVAAFSWDRWLRYDDARELQGEWQVDGTTRIVVVDGASIKLTDDVSYSYAIDPAAKTISFAFGNMEGSGRYRFSADRSRLVVVEGGSYSLWSTLVEDIAWMWDGLVRSTQGLAPVEPEAGDGTTVFVRVSHDAAAQPRDDAALVAGDAEAQDEGAAPAPDAPDNGQEPVEAPPAENPPAEPEPLADASADPSADAPDEEPPDARGEAPADDEAAVSPRELFDVSDV